MAKAELLVANGHRYASCCNFAIVQSVGCHEFNYGIVSFQGSTVSIQWYSALQKIAAVWQRVD